MASYRNAILPALCLAGALGLSGAAQAADSGFYLGGSIGQTTLKVPSDVTDVPDFNEDDTGYKLYGGYNFNLALFNLGVEGGYIDFGSPSGSLDTDTSLKIDAETGKVEPEFRYIVLLRKKDAKAKIIKVLQMLRVKKYDVPMIAHYRKHEYSDELDEDSIWVIFQLDQEYGKFEKQKKQIADFLQKIT